MAKKLKVPNAIERRELLYGKPKKVPDFEALGRSYLDAGRRNDALESFEKVRKPELRAALIKELKQGAIKDGIWFLLNRIHNSDPVSESEWLETSRNARSAGKLQYALKSAERAGDEALVTELRGEMGLPIESDEPEPAEGETADEEAGEEG